jgi:hypothetical protein
MWDNIKLFFSVYFKTLSDLLGGFSFLTDLAEIMAYITILLCAVVVVGSVFFACFGLFVVLIG